MWNGIQDKSVQLDKEDNTGHWLTLYIYLDGGVCCPFVSTAVGILCKTHVCPIVFCLDVWNP